MLLVTNDGGDTGSVVGVADVRLRAELRKQIGFLERSAKAFDEGHEEEGVRLATVMRVLFHDTVHPKTGKPNSISLLTHLAMRDGTMLATPPTHFADWRDFLAVKIDLTSATPTSLLPRLDLQLREVPFAVWWDSDSVKAKASVSRRRLITNAANKDGGAHVDPKLGRFYEELMHADWSLGITGDMTYDGPPPFEQGVTQYPKNAHLALLRQFAYEVLATAQRFSWH
jgi:hypothetical protein